MDSLARDLKLSLRLLFRTPGFSLAAVALLALGIGLNTGMFSVLNALIFSPRGFADPERVVQLYSASTKPPGGYRAFSYPVSREIAARSDVFEGVLAQNFTIVGVGEAQETRRSFSALVSANYFRVLGVPPALGRAFTSEGARSAEVQVLVVREGLATSLLGIALGLGVGAAVGRVLSSVVVDVRAFDPVAFGASTAALLAAAALASYLPARRAARIEPLDALRAE